MPQHIATQFVNSVLAAEGRLAWKRIRAEWIEVEKSAKRLRDDFAAAMEHPLSLPLAFPREQWEEPEALLKTTLPHIVEAARRMAALAEESDKAQPRKSNATDRPRDEFVD